MFTDASEQGWRAHTQTIQTGGHWLDSEVAHINVLELKAFEKFVETITSLYAFVDSVTILAYVKNMGGTCLDECLKVATDIWEWTQLNNNWLTISKLMFRDLTMC